MSARDMGFLPPAYQLQKDTVYVPAPVPSAQERAARKPSKPYTEGKKMLFALRTNMLAIPLANVGVEVPLGRHFSLGADYYYPWIWRPHHTEGLDYSGSSTELLALDVEARYWFPATNPPPSQRLLGHSIGTYAAVGYYDFERNASGYQGEFYNIGLDYLFAVPLWEARPSDGAAITFTNTKTADVDLVWATANGQSPQAAPVALAFSHALARLVIQVQATGLSDGKLRLKSVVLQTGPEERLALGGTFTIDNTRNVPTGSWSRLTTLSDYGFFTGQNITFGADGLTSLVGLLNGTARKAREGVLVPLVNMFVPEQGNKNLVVTYSLYGAADTVETINLLRDTWKMGKTYTYQLVFDGSAGLEIVYNPPFGPGPEENW